MIELLGYQPLAAAGGVEALQIHGPKDTGTRVANRHRDAGHERPATG